MKTPVYNQNKGYESNKQEAKNLISMNPLSKHMSTPMNMGGSKSAMMMKGAMKGGGMPINNPIKKTKKKIEQDLSRNQIRDKEDGDTKAANYEGKELIKVASGEQKR